MSDMAIYQQLRQTFINLRAVGHGNAASHAAGWPADTHAAPLSHAAVVHDLLHNAVAQGLEVMGWSAPIRSGAHYFQAAAEGERHEEVH
jgi:hypothetical protein